MATFRLMSLVVLCLGVGLQHCGTPERSPDGSPTRIVFWHSFVSSSVPALEQLIRRFEEEHPQIRIDAQYVPTGDALVQKLITAIQSRTAPDLAWIHTDFLDKLVEAEALRPLEEFFIDEGGALPPYIADIFPQLLDAGTYDGTIWTVPMEATSLALVYNRGLFRKAGLDPDKPPETWEELERYAQQLTVDEDGDGRIDRYGFLVPVFPSSSDLNIWMVQQWLPFLWQAGGMELSDDLRRATFDESAGVAALTLWRRMYDSLNMRTFTMAHDMAFASGKLAMVLDGPWDLPRYRAARKLDWAVAPLPGGRAGRATVVAGEHLAIFRQSEHPDAAWTFVRWMLNPSVQAEFSVASGYLPVRKSSLELASYRDYLATDKPLAAYVRTIGHGRSRRLPRTKRVEFNRFIAEAIERATSGGEDPGLCLREAAKKFNMLGSE